MAVRTELNCPPAAWEANWKRSTVSMLESVSVSRLTLLPLSRVGSSEVAGLGGGASVAGGYRLSQGVLEGDALGVVVGGVDVCDVVRNGPLAQRQSVEGAGERNGGHRVKHDGLP